MSFANDAKKRKTIGIIGGMGPDATAKLFKEIVSLTPAGSDQEHIPVLVYSNPCIPDRTLAILNRGESPVAQIVKTAKVLESGNADILAMPCNTSHYFYNEIQSQVNLPIVNMIDEVVNHIQVCYPKIKKIGLLATNGTIIGEVYHEKFQQNSIEVITPENLKQDLLVMEAIFGKKGIKAGYFHEPQSLIIMAANDLISRGAEVLLAGCTEIPLVLNKHPKCPVLDSSKILAQKLVQLALSREVTAMVD